MLHEILLSLSGHPSPIWKQVKQTPQSTDKESLTQYISPPEHAMLVTLGHLSDLHIQLRDHTKQISSSHPSMICRAVASSISGHQLAKFRSKVVEVEASVLSKDAEYVGGYGIVPLSTIVGQFAPWTRRLEWLRDVVRHILPHDGHYGVKARCTGAMLIDFLENETYTGYSDLEEMATELLTVAHTAWLRQVSAWIFYGNLPSYGAEDFFVHIAPTGLHASDAARKEGALSRELLPHFVSLPTAESVLTIGNALNHIRSHSRKSSEASSLLGRDPALELLPQHLEYFRSLTCPLSSASFANVISLIRASISQNILSHLLPLQEVVDTLGVLHDYLLLGRGEFAVSLINQADLRIAARNNMQDSIRPIRKAGRLDEMAIKDAELAIVLQQTWSELASLQNDEDLQDETFERASSLLQLARLPSTGSDKVISTIFPTPSVLTLSLKPDSSLSLFLRADDIQTYSSISTYLLSIRRAQLHLSSLWKITSLRRCHPTPLGPPLSATRAGAAKLAVQRARDEARMKQMRKHWATAGKALFVLNELGTYFQGEVVGRHWSGFRAWMEDMAGSRPASRNSRPGSAKTDRLKTSQTSHASGVLQTSIDDDRLRHQNRDPATLAGAHRACLSAIYTGLLLDYPKFVTGLRELLTIVDHFIALFSRLQIVWQGLDLQEDEGVVDALMNYKKDEGEVWWEMERSGRVVEEKVAGVVDWIRDRDRRAAEEGAVRKEEDVVSEVGEMDLAGARGYVPWKGRTIERLIMKLEVLAGGLAAAEGDADGAGLDYDND